MRPPAESIVGNSPALAHALDEVSRLAAVNRPLLILGERGTGKELIAQRLHYLSPRWGAPLLKVNCAAIAESLLEAELFGHEAGAFTGASRSRRGIFERADGGTLFLDELANMSLRLQEKLLRLVEYGEFERLGGQETLTVDVRVLAATNANLPQLASEGKFRHDLLDRLTFDIIHVPALSQRPEDIPELARHFAIQMCAELGWNLFAGFSAEALNELQAHPWPGNVRELKNVVERSLHRWGDPDTEVAEVVIDAFYSPYSGLSPYPVHSPSGSAPEPEPARAPSPAGAENPLPQDFAGHMGAIEKKFLAQALAESGNNQRLTAAALGLSYDQLRGLVRKHQLGGRRRKLPTSR